MALRAFYLFVALLSAAPAVAEPFVEKALPPNQIPKFVRIDAANYNVRTTREFASAKTDNVDFQSAKGRIFPVRNAVQMENGIALNVLVVDEKTGRYLDRWIYVPRARRGEFQFCQSAACFTDLAQVLKVLSTQEIGQKDLAECGLQLSADGSLLRSYLPRDISKIPLPSPRPRREAARNQRELERARRQPAERRSQRRNPQSEPEYREPTPPPGTRRMTVAPLWEAARPGKGRQWTSYMRASLRKHGRTLLTTRSLADAKNWCPNYSRLTDLQREEFWIHLMNGMAKYESGFKTNTTFNERLHRNQSRGRLDPKYHSQGLFQLSYGSAGQPAYSRFCNFDLRRNRGKDISDQSLSIYDPAKNIECAVGILNYWVKKTGYLGTGSGERGSRGGAKFWSTLRSTNPAKAKVRATLKRFTPCGLR